MSESKLSIQHELQGLAVSYIKLLIDDYEPIIDTDEPRSFSDYKTDWKYRAKSGVIIEVYPSYGGILQVGDEIEIDDAPEHQAVLSGKATIAGFRLPVMKNKTTDKEINHTDYIILALGYNNGEPACVWIKPSMIKSSSTSGKNISKQMQQRY